MYSMLATHYYRVSSLVVRNRDSDLNAKLNPDDTVSVICSVYCTCCRLFCGLLW